jgi:hypothetical protein
VGLALMALALVMALDERPLEGLGRHPAVVCLGGVALLALVSAAWTVGASADAVRSGLVVGALVAVALTSGWVVRAGGMASVAALIGALAVAEALFGLTSVALRDAPWAERIGGSWRPGGTFEYPPALALLQVATLPILGWAMFNRRRTAAGLGAFAATLAGATIALTESRIGLVLAIATVVASVLVARGADGIGPRRGAAAALLPATGGLAAVVVLGGYSPAGAGGEDPAALIALLSVAVLVGLAWPVVRERAAKGAVPGADARQSSRRPLAALVGGAVVLAAAALISFSSGSGGTGVEPVSGVDHGRIDEWQVAAGTALAHPALGAGADGYAVAAAEHGGGGTLYAHSMPLEAWAELGPLGFGLVVGLYASVIALAWRLRRDPRAWLFIPAVVGFLAANLADWPWHLAGAAAVWATALGALLALRPRRVKENDASGGGILPWASGGLGLRLSGVNRRRGERSG